MSLKSEVRAEIERQFGDHILNITDVTPPNSDTYTALVRTRHRRGSDYYAVGVSMSGIELLRADEEEARADLIEGRVRQARIQMNSVVGTAT